MQYFIETISLMTLSKETKIGLTFGQIISVLSLIGAIITVYINLNMRVAQAEVRISNTENGRRENSQKIEKLYDQSREDYKAIISRLDDIRDKLDTKQDK